MRGVSILKPIISAKISYLINYSNQLYKESKGLHLNSKDWKAFIHVGKPQYYTFLKNGTIEFFTKSQISKQQYRQPVKMTNFKKLEPLLLLLYLTGNDENVIAEFLSLFLKSDDVKIFCECPAFSFWGPHYNLTQMKSAYGPGENRPPDVRDKKRKNVVCKHLWLVINEYENLTKPLATGLLWYYKRFFGIASPTGVERLKKTLGLKGIKKVIEQAITDLNKINSNVLSARFKFLTHNKLNNILTPTQKPVIPTKPKIKTEPENIQEIDNKEIPTEKIKEQPKIEKVKKINTEPEVEEFSDDDIDEMLNNVGALRSKKNKSKYILI